MWFIRIFTRMHFGYASEDAQYRVRVADINDEKHDLQCDFSRTVPLRTVCSPCSVRTCRNPRPSRPSVVPSKAAPFSSIRTFFPNTHEEFCAKRCKIDPRASGSSTNCRYSRSSDFSKAATSSTRDHSLPVTRRNEVADKYLGKLA